MQTLNISTISGVLRDFFFFFKKLKGTDGWKTDQIVLLIAVPATGAMTLTRMLYFFPSKASVFVRPMIPALAVEYCNSLLLLSWGPTLKMKPYISLTKVPIYKRASKRKEQGRDVDIHKPTCEEVVTMRPYFCLWKTGHAAFAHWITSRK